LFVYVFHIIELYLYIVVLYANIDQSLVKSLHGLLNCEIGGLDWHVITTEYRTRAIVFAMSLVNVRIQYYYYTCDLKRVNNKHVWKQVIICHKLGVYSNMC